MEAYAPTVFTSEFPACTVFHKKCVDTLIQSDPIGEHFALPNHRAFTQKYPLDHQVHLSSHGFPSTVQDLIDRKLPQLVLHILSFHDATILTLSFPPTTMDAAGFKAFLENWSLCMANKPDEVTPIFGSHQDALEKLVTEAEEKQPLGELIMDKRLTALTPKLAPNWWRRRSHQPMQSRMVYIPKDIYNDFMIDIREDIAGILEEDDERPVTTDADIILAWISKLQAATDLKQRGVLSTSIVNLRCHLSTFRDPTVEFLQSLTLPAYSYISPEEATDTIGAIALQQKHNMHNQMTEHQLLTLTKHIIQKKKSGKNPLPIYDAPSIPHLEFNNFSPLRLFSAVDFSPAVLCSGEFEAPRYNLPGAVTAAYRLMRDTNDEEPVCSVLGKDCGGNFWMTGHLEPAVWVKVEEELYNLQKTVNSPTSGHSMRFFDYNTRRVSIRSTF